MFFTLCYKYVKQKLYNMKNEFDETGIAILKTLLPNCEFLKIDEEMIIKRGEKEVYLKAKFDKLFEQIYKDRDERGVDSTEWYWKHFGNVIEQELNNS